MIDVIIPTYRRADKLRDLVENIHATTSVPHTIHLVMEIDDVASRGIVGEVGADTMVGRFGSFAKAVNRAYRRTRAPFFIAANDDCVFHEEWATIAFAHFSEHTHIVGLNDGSGDTKCFALARRAYIEQHSGVYDKPNTVYHEYASQCCDTEFAFYALLRGVWADAPYAVVEHIHWRFGKAAPDHPNYVKARATNQEDLAEYERRRQQWDPERRTPDCRIAAA